MNPYSHPSKELIGSEGTQLRGRKIVIGVTGSVAAVQAPEIARLLMRYGAEVYAVLSQAAKTIIHPFLMEWATGNPVVTELTGKIEHVSLAGNHDQKADLILVAPATANTISKIAMGIDDTPVTSTVTTAFGASIPIMIVPAMHASMYQHPILLENIEKLKSHGVEFIGPRLEEGKAKIATSKEILKAILKKFGIKHDFSKKKILVTAGPTIEYIDPVRIVTSRSSGRMGIEIANVAYERGADVTLVYGQGSIPPPKEFKTISVQTTQEMLDAVVTLMDKTKFDIVISAAAVADWKPIEPHKEKISTDSDPTLTITFKPTPKIVDTIRKLQKSTFLVLFKAEHGVSDNELVDRAYQRLKKVNGDLIIANDVARPGVGFATETNELFIIDKTKQVTHIPRTHKRKAAQQILDIIAKKLAS